MKLINVFIFSIFAQGAEVGASLPAGRQALQGRVTAVFVEFPSRGPVPRMASSRDQGKVYFQRGKFAAAADSYTVPPQPAQNSRQHALWRKDRAGTKTCRGSAAARERAPLPRIPRHALMLARHFPGIRDPLRSGLPVQALRPTLNS